MARLLHLVTATAIVLLVAAFLPSAASAECLSSDPWPAFTEVAPTAERIVIGRVTGAGLTALGTLGFRLEVQNVLRGPSAKTMDFRDVRPPAPLRCPDSALRTRPGDIIAIAINGRVPGSARLVTTFAYLEGTPNAFYSTGIQRLSRDQIMNAIGLPNTDTVPVAGPPPGRGAPLPFLAALATLIALLAAPISSALARRTRTRS